jgi:glycosyltransferase involved in cell wall biosynthesis
MNIIHITTSNRGGAGLAALRLHESLLEQGVNSKLLSWYQFPSSVKEQYLFREQDCSRFPLLISIKELILKVFKRFGLYRPLSLRYAEKHLKNQPLGFEHFSFPFSSFDISKHPLIKKADVIHLHWVSDGFIDYASFFKGCNKKIIWTLHDMNPFTGGCHHSDGCTKFEMSCTICPQLKNTIDENYSETILKIKQSALSGINNSQIQITAPSKWLTDLSAKSTLFKRFRHQTIHNIINKSVFKVQDKAETRKKLKLPLDKQIVLFVSHDVSNTRKGIDLLVKALSQFENNDALLICSVGSSPGNFDFTVPHIKMEYVNDEQTMAQLYSAADVFVLPSVAENFPNTICESLLCGTPVVAFNVGGIPELINDLNGKLVEPFDVNKLYLAIKEVLQNQAKFDFEQIGRRAAELLNEQKVTEHYIGLYSQLN